MEFEPLIPSVKGYESLHALHIIFICGIRFICFMNFDLVCVVFKRKVSKIWLVHRNYQIFSLFYGDSNSSASYYGQLNTLIYLSSAGSPIKQLASLLPYYRYSAPGNQWSTNCKVIRFESSFIEESSSNNLTFDINLSVLFQNKVAGTTTPAGTGKVNNIYGHMVVGEESEDSENSSVYHEPYKLLPSTKQEYGCLLKKDTLSSSKSGEYTGEWLPLKYMLLWDRRFIVYALFFVNISQQVVNNILVLSLYSVIHCWTWKYAMMSQFD